MKRTMTATVTPVPSLEDYEDHLEEPTKMMWTLKVDTVLEVSDILAAADTLGVTLELVKEATKPSAQRRFEVTVYVILPGVKQTP